MRSSDRDTSPGDLGTISISCSLEVWGGGWFCGWRATGKHPSSRLNSALELFIFYFRYWLLFLVWLSHTFHSLQPLQKRGLLQGVNKEMNRFTNPSINNNTPLGRKLLFFNWEIIQACLILLHFILLFFTDIAFFFFFSNWRFVASWCWTNLPAPLLQHLCSLDVCMSHSDTYKYICKNV